MSTLPPEPLASMAQELGSLAPLLDEGAADWAAVLKAHKISAAEYVRLRTVVGRAPTYAELGVFSAMWSEHCSYKSSRLHLGRLHTEAPHVVVGPGENAGVVRLHGKICVAFKMESHNHPSYIEPYQGAATGVGGILRDVFCMGARPVANMNALRFGAPEHPRTAYLVENATQGIGDYGNCVGVPTVGGNISFDATYNGNCLINAFTAGLIHEDHIFKGYATGPGNLVVYIGSATGRDGIHGATMASDSFSSSASGSKTTIQVGDPFAEKLLIEATLECLEKGLVVGLQDMGAAGLTSSAFEMADRAGNGIFLDLDRVPLRAKGMSAYEILLSESQERMLMVITPENWQGLVAVLKKWGLHYAAIGRVTSTGRVQIHYQGRLEVDVAVQPLTEAAPKYQRPMLALMPQRHPLRLEDAVQKYIMRQGPTAVLAAALGPLQAKAQILPQYDRHIGYRTVMSSHEEGAAVLWIHSPWEGSESAPHLGLVLSSACNERYCESEPRLGAAHAIAKAARMIAATGAEPLAATDCLNFGNPEDPRVMMQFSESIDGLTEACQHLAIPIVSGNVSLYNETDGRSIYPTPMIGMVGRHDDVRLAVPAKINKPGILALVAPTQLRFSFGGSLLAKLAGQEPTLALPPPLDYAQEIEAMALLQGFAAAKKLVAARDIGEGGMITTLAKMLLGSGLSASLDLNLEGASALGYDNFGFAELQGAYLVVLADAKVVDEARFLGLERTHTRIVGKIYASPQPELRVEGERIAIPVIAGVPSA